MKKKNKITIRSSASEYLTFVAATGGGGVDAVYADENVWLTQKMMGILYDIDVRTINYHLKKIFDDAELDENSVIQNFRITATDGKTYDTKERLNRFLPQQTERFCKMPAKLRLKLLKLMPRVSSKNTALYKTGCLKVILIDFWKAKSILRLHKHLKTTIGSSGNMVGKVKNEDVRELIEV
ncbi:MAG: hypothetical protein FWG13_03425 [Leptospirales bacterium]|nr:hypothetical protein [Leptospirales bacterium]